MICRNYSRCETFSMSEKAIIDVTLVYRSTDDHKWQCDVELIIMFIVISRETLNVQRPLMVH